MHGPSPGVSLLVNADADSMEGVVEYGVGVSTKASPRRAAIEEAQAELRQEYDVREQRRRELEFLEKGGNPLDFKSGHSASISIHSTSLTDQPAEQYVTSEAKGSFAMAASPQGDSNESSGRPGSVVCRNPNTDNLSMCDGDNSNNDYDINAKRKGKRGSAVLLVQPSKIGSSTNAKESEDIASFRVGAKGQAYARRNRSRPNRNNPILVSADQGLHHGNTSSTTTCPRGTKAPLSVALVERCTVSTINDSKAASLRGNTEMNIKTSDDHLDTVSDNIMVMDSLKQGADEMKAEHKQENDQNYHFKVAERAPDSVASQSSGVIGKDEALSVGVVLESSGTNVCIVTDENTNVSSVPDISMIHENIIQTTENIIEADQKQDHCSLDGTKDIDENGDRSQSLLLKTKEILDEDLKGESSNAMNSIFQDDNDLKDSQLMVSNAPANTDNEPGPVQANIDSSAVQIKTETESFSNKNDMQSATVTVPNNDCLKSNSEFTCDPIMEVQNSLSDQKFIKDADATVSAMVSPTCETQRSAPILENSASSELQNSQQFELEKKMHEDAILKEAQQIEANRKWAGELSICYKTSEKRHKCHWDFVLEEMSWAANDFMQERLWKITAAAHVAKQIAYGDQATIEKLNIPRRQKKVARSLAKAVMQFWHSTEVLQRSDVSPNGSRQECNPNMLNAWKGNGNDGQNDQVSPASGLPRPVLQCAIQDYAVRFLKHQSTSSEYVSLAVAPATPDRENDVGILELSSEDQLSEESLCYVVPPGAMQTYRESMESQWVHCKKVVNALHQADYEISMCGSVADGTPENIYDEDQGDTFTYILPGASSSGLSSKFTLKKKKLVHQKSYASKLYEVSPGLSYEPGLESKSGSQPFPLNGKRPSSAMNVGLIPTKRIRTAARRVIPPYTSGLTASVQVTSKTDVSSGETSSPQDDQSSLNGGSLPRKNLEVESTMDFERQMSFDGDEVLKSKKKKKPKHLGYRNSLNLDDSSLLFSGKGSSYEQRLQLDRMVQDQPKDHGKRRLDIQHFDSNGVAVSYGHHAAKKPKLLKQLPDTLPDVLTPATGSVPSPVASQMSNMSNSNKLMKIISNRDRGRKTKGLKMPAGYSGTGSQWSSFEDQALVVLVHDMGPNWELVSDAINSALQFKCIFRKPKECKERHKFLIDKSAGDGADSAEDSGSSQPYPSTLPGIPKGSARQLFQRLQGPMEEDTLRAHFDKIISLNQQLHSCRRQEVKQIIPAHSSHAVALSQVCPNKLSGAILTPLDHCESNTSSPDFFSHGYQGSQNELAVGNHPGSVTPIPPSGANTTLQGSPGVVLSSSLPPPTPMSISPRDAQRYALPRPTVLPVDDPQRMQQYNPMLVGRNIPQSSIPLPGSFPVGVDRGVRMLAGGNGMGMMCGMPRNMPMPRTGFQGLSSPGMLNMVSASNMISSSGLGMQNQVNVHPGAVSAAGNSMLRPRDSLQQMLRPGQNTDMMMQELQLHVSQGNGQTVTPFNGMGTSFSNATVASTLQTFPLQQHQGHMLGNSHQPHLQGANQTSSPQSYAIQQRKIQQRMAPQPNHSFSGASTASSVQNNSQLHSQIQSSSSPVTAVPNSQAQNMPRSSQSNIQNQIMKQRQRQQPQQQPRQQQQQRQQSQQQAKLVKGLGRGNIILSPNLPGDASQINGPSTVPKSQGPEKQLMQQNQGFFPGSPSMNSGQTKMYPGSLPQSSKQMTAVSDTCNQSLAQDPSNTHMVASQQTAIPSSVSLPSTHQQQQQRYMSQNQQTIQKMVQQNRQSDSDTRIHTPTDQVQINPMTSASISPANAWKSDTNSSTKMVHVPNSSAEMVGSDTLPTSSGQGMVPSQQFSGNASMHGHGIVGQRQQAPQPQHQLQQPQHQIRQAVQGELSTQPNSSAG